MDTTLNDGERWTLDKVEWLVDHLKPGEDGPTTYPNAATTERLALDIHSFWCRTDVNEPLTLYNLGRWLAGRLRIDKNQMELEDQTLHFMGHNTIVLRLMQICEENSYDKYLMEKLKECVNQIENVQQLYIHFKILMNPDAKSRKCRRLSNDKMTNFQNAFLYLTRILLGMDYRRTAGTFFRRINTRSGLCTNAFEEAETIQDFVIRHGSYAVNYRLWAWLTDPDRNGDAVVKHLKEKPLPEAPDLVEDCHLWSYEGDSVGRGAGVYDCASDMFFPYIMRPSWKDMADLAERVRRRTNPDYKCVPPTETSVCVIHLNCGFPYDMWGEMCCLADIHIGTRWRNADPFECNNPSLEVTCPELAAYLAQKLPPIHTDDEWHPRVIGEAWQLVFMGRSFPPEGETWEELDSSEIRDQLAESNRQGVVHLPDTVPFENVAMNHFITLGEGEDTHFYVPLETPRARRRATVSDDDLHWFGFVSESVREGSFVKSDRNGATRCFRLDTGRTWLDCDAKEIDHIFSCQKFGIHDRFMLYALLGRMFFEVGEIDTYQITLFLEGVGGCGKSTIMKAAQAFWPAHLRGILSPNMQPQFGMSAVSHAKAVFCNEVSDSLNIVQEEWQTACSGEEGSYAVKFEKPIVMKWKSQMFWVGNGFPTCFKNTNGRVTRRLGGVLMNHTVVPRNGNIQQQIYAKLGALQRKQVLAYKEFFRINGTIDPMSQADSLPPAFAEYNKKIRRATDPMEDFLSDGTFVMMDPMGRMLMDEFKELYGEYRIKFDLGRMVKRWGEEHYRTAFNDRGVTVSRQSSIHINGTQYQNVDVIWGITQARL